MPTALAPRLVGDERIELVEIDYPEPGAGQLLLRARADALCGSDRPIYTGGSAIIAGHEIAGEVVAAGPGTATAVGTRGVVYLMSYCGHCRNCLAGRTNICLEKRGDSGFTRHGGLGPYTVIDEPQFFPVDDDIPFALATMLLDVMGTSGHVLDRAELVSTDIRSVHIAGAGPVGLGALVMARIRYGAAVDVHISDVSPWRLDFAASLGGLPVHADAVGSLPEVDLAIDASGRTSARQAALDRVRKGGVMVCAGHGQELRLAVSSDLIASERTLLGSEYFPFADLARNLALLRAHRDTIGRVITHSYDVADLGEAFTTFLGGEAAKVVVTQEGGA